MAIGFMTITVAILFVGNRLRGPYLPIAISLALFSFFCGLVELFSALSLWRPDQHWLTEPAQIVAAITALFAAYRLIKTYVGFHRHPARGSVSSQAEARLRRAQEQLEATVRERTLDLRFEAERTKAIADTAASCLFLQNEFGYVTYMNPAAERVTGYSLDEIRHRPLHDLIHHHHPDSTAQQIECCPIARVCWEQGNVREKEDYFVRKDGTRFPAQYSVSSFFKDGKVAGAVLELRDISEKRAGEDNLKRWEHVFRSATWGMALTTPENQIIEVNPAFAKMHGTDVHEWIGRTLLDALAHESKPSFVENLHEPSLSSQFAFETVHVRKDGSYFPALMEASELKGANGEVIFRAFNVQDITDRKLHEQEVHRSRAQLEASFHAMNDGIMVFNLEGHAIFCNEAQARIGGYSSAQDLIRDMSYFKETYDVYHLDGTLVPYEDWPIARILRGESITSWELKVKRLDTNVTWYFNFSGEPVKNEVGEQTLGILIIRDVTTIRMAENALRESEIRFRELADSMPQIVWSAGADGQVDYFNERWSEYTGDSDSQFTASKWSDLVHPDDFSAFESQWRESLEKGQSFQMEHRLQNYRTRRYRWFLTRAVPVKNQEGQITRWFGTATDIDDQKIVSNKLRQAVAARDDFMSIASHELKTPLTALKLQAQIAKRNLNKGNLSFFDPNQLRQFADQLDMQVDRLSRLVDDMLDISRIQSGKLTTNFENMDLNQLAKDVVDRMAPSLRNAGCTVNFKFKRSALGYWDSYRLEQILTNLISNAMKYGAGKPIDVSVDADDRFATLSVRDAGMGISPENHQRIFERFERAVSSTNIGGLGLGLYIVKEIVRTHSGRIFVNSDLGKGAEFKVQLPLFPKTPHHMRKAVDYEF